MAARYKIIVGSDASKGDIHVTSTVSCEIGRQIEPELTSDFFDGDVSGTRAASSRVGEAALNRGGAFHLVNNSAYSASSGPSNFPPYNVFFGPDSGTTLMSMRVAGQPAVVASIDHRIALVERHPRSLRRVMAPIRPTYQCSSLP